MQWQKTSKYVRSFLLSKKFVVFFFIIIITIFY